MQIIRCEGFKKVRIGRVEYISHKENKTDMDEFQKMEINIRKMTNEDSILASSKLLENIYPNKNFNFKEFVSQNSEEYIADIERLGTMGFSLEDSIEKLKEYTYREIITKFW